MQNSVRRTSNHSQQGLLREEDLSLTQENAQSTGILQDKLACPMNCCQKHKNMIWEICYDKPEVARGKKV